jgi:RNA polymerase sigma-70 factor (ECF subfamily)
MMDWEGIVRNHGAMVWRTLFRLLGCRSDVEETFQETFLAALEAARWRKIANMSGFLQTLATRKAMDCLRRKYQVLEATDSAAVEAIAGASPSPEEFELSGELQRALVRIPAKQAEMICLHALSGWSYQEIGEQLGMSSTAVGVMIHRGKQRLREILEPWQSARRGGAS